MAVQDGLADFMGEATAQILVMGISEGGFKSPAQFVREVSKVFGQGALPLYTAILRTASDPAWIPQGDGTIHYKARTGGLGANETGAAPAEERTLYLHDQRDPDEFSEEDPH